MDLSKYLPVSIVQTVGGVFIVCALLGLATFFVQDWMSSLLRWRYDLLADTIRNMLADSHLTKILSEHSLTQNSKKQHHKTKYISGTQSAGVLFDIIMRHDTDTEQTSQTTSIGTFDKFTQNL